MCISTGAIVLPAGKFEAEPPLPKVVGDVECEGNESFLLSCPVSKPPGECPSGKGAAIVCQGKHYCCSSFFKLIVEN